MKIGIISDSHDNKEKIIRAVSVFNRRKVDHVIHAGDIVSPFTYGEFSKLDMPLSIVYGNNDGELLGLKRNYENIEEPPLDIVLGDKKILVLHVPKGLEAFRYSGLYDYIIYGHTHNIEVTEGKTTVINPGECCGWLTGRYTVAILDLKDGKTEIIDI